MKIKRILCGVLAMPFLLMTACTTGSSSSGSSDAPSSAPSSRPSSGNSSTVSTSDPGADSGDKGTLYMVRYDRWALRNKQLKDDMGYHYDIVMLVTCLQGILNREKPTIFVAHDYSTEKVYLDHMRRTADDALHGYKLVDVDSPKAFFEIFGDDIKRLGLIAWDENVPATSLTSATACGIDGYLPVRYNTAEDSLYTYLTGTLGAEVKIDLVGRFTGKGTVWGTDRKSTGSTKGDAYVWALENYMDKCEMDYLAYLSDAAAVFQMEGTNNPFSYGIIATTVPDFDFFVMKKSFFFDLGVWPDELPPDDPTQPMGTDYAVLTEILQRTYDKHGGSTFTQVTGVPNCFYKYGEAAARWGTPSTHEIVDWEFRMGRLLTSYNMVCDGDCGGFYSCFNCSIYCQQPLQEFYPNTNKPEKLPAFDEDKYYVMFHMGDFDSGAWTVYRTAKFWKDPALGSVPLAWAFNPNIGMRVAAQMDYVRVNATKNDYFIGGDSGAGYAFPMWMTEEYRKDISGLPSGLDAWVSWNKKFYKQYDLSITGHVHNGSTGMTDDVLWYYNQFSPDGISSWNIPDNRKYLVNGELPTIGSYRNMAVDTGMSVKDSVKVMSDVIESSRYPYFYFFRTVITPPGRMAEIVNALKKQYPQVEIVDPYTFFGLMKQALSE